MRKIYILFLFTLLTNSLHAYKVGDTVSNKFFIDNNIDSKKLVIVDFFASWCVSCQKELPLINSLNKEIDYEKTTILGIDTDENISDGVSFQKKLNLKFRVINDPEYKIVNSFSPIGMPALYYIKNKKIVKIIYGAVHNIDKVIQTDIEGL